MNKLVTLFHAWYFDLGRALGNLDATVAKLEKVAAHHAELAAVQRDVARKAAAQAVQADAVATKATLVKTNISSLLGN